MVLYILNLIIFCGGGGMVYLCQYTTTPVSTLLSARLSFQDICRLCRSPGGVAHLVRRIITETAVRLIV